MLDLFLTEPNLEQTHEFSKEAPLRSSHYIKVMGSDDLQIIRLPAYKAATDRLRLWMGTSPGFISLLKLAMYDMSYRYTDFKLALVPQYVFPESVHESYPKAALKSAILYDKTLGSIVSLSAWNTLGDQSQAALIVHEALRYLQLTKSVAITNSEIQVITSQIILGSPEMGTSLFVPKFEGEELTDVQAIENDYRGKKSLRATACPLIDSIMELMSQHTLWDDEAEAVKDFCNNPDFLFSPFKALLMTQRIYGSLTLFQQGGPISNIDLLSKDFEELSENLLDSMIRPTTLNYLAGYYFDLNSPIPTVFKDYTRDYVEGNLSLIPSNQLANIKSEVNDIANYYKQLREDGVLLDSEGDPVLKEKSLPQSNGECPELAGEYLQCEIESPDFGTISKLVIDQAKLGNGLTKFKMFMSGTDEKGKPSSGSEVYTDGGAPTFTNEGKQASEVSKTACRSGILYIGNNVFYQGKLTYSEIDAVGLDSGGRLVLAGVSPKDPSRPLAHPYFTCRKN